MKLAVNKSNLVSVNGNINLVGECVTRRDINECHSKLQKAERSLRYRRGIHLIVYCLMLSAIFALGLLIAAFVSRKLDLDNLGIACGVFLCLYAFACAIYLSKRDDAAISSNLKECRSELLKLEDIWGAYTFFTNLSEGDTVELLGFDKNGLVFAWRGCRVKLELFDAISGIIRNNEDGNSYVLENVVIDFSVARSILLSIRENIGAPIKTINISAENVREGSA